MNTERMTALTVYVDAGSSLNSAACEGSSWTLSN